MLFLYFAAFCPVLVAFVVYTYGAFKLPKQNVSLVRDFIYDRHQDGSLIPLNIGHRGGQFEAPENTLQAIKTAHLNGATAVEIDLDFTVDKVPVIIHDDTVDRTTDGRGYVTNMTYEKLRQLNAAAKAPKIISRDGNVTEIEFEYIPTLQEATNLCIDLGMKIILDVKSHPELTAKVLKELAEKDERAYNHILVTSFRPEVIYNVRKADPRYLTGIIWRFGYYSRDITGKPRYSGLKHWIYEAFELLSFYCTHTIFPEFLGISAVSMHKDHISMRYLRQWRQKGIEVIAWTVNHPLEKDYFLNYYKVPVITDSILNKMDCPEQSN